MKRLLFICHGFPPYYGGAEHAAHDLALAAARTGRYAVSVLTSDLGGRLPREEQIEGMQIVRLPCRKKAWTRHTVPELLSFLLAGLRRVRSLAASLRPDYILGFFSFPEGAVAERLARRAGVSCAVLLHGSDVPGYQPDRYGALYALLRPIVRRVWRRAATVIAVSAPLRTLAAETWPEGAADIAVIPNGVDTEFFHPPAEPRAAGGPLRLICAAQLIERKGINFLLDALAAPFPGVEGALELTLYGSGPCAEALQQQAETADLGDRVRFGGLATREELAGALREADVFVLPALQEGLPLAVLEAMSSGLPVVVTAVGGLPTLIEEGRNGLLVPPGSADALHDALARLARDPDLRVRLGRGARRTAEARGWATVWRRYEAACGLGHEAERVA